MRTSCTECAIKHLSTALALIMEAGNGYPEHTLIAIGELAQAEHELLDRYPEMAARVRAERLRWREGRHDADPYDIPFIPLMQEVEALGNDAIVDIADPSQPTAFVTGLQTQIDKMYSTVEGHEQMNQGKTPP